MVMCLEWRAYFHTAQVMPLPLTVSCFSKIQIGLTFLVPAHLGSLAKGVCVCVCKLRENQPHEVLESQHKRSSIPSLRVLQSIKKASVLFSTINSFSFSILQKWRKSEVSVSSSLQCWTKLAMHEETPALRTQLNPGVIQQKTENLSVHMAQNQQ